MRGSICSVPDVLFAAECNHANGSGKVPAPAAAFERDADRMRILSILVDEQQGPLAVWTPNCIARDQIIPGGVFDSDIDGIEVMSAAAMGHPLVIDHAAGGKPLSERHSVGMVSTTAVGSLAATAGPTSRAFLEELWNTPVPSGEQRYFDGLLYLMSMMHCSGNFRIY